MNGDHPQPATPQHHAPTDAAPIAVSFDLPAELRDLVGPPEALAARARRALVLDLLRAGEIGQGTAARLLGITRYDILDLMAEHEIRSGPLTAEELDRDVEAAMRGAVRRSLHAGG